MNCPKCGSAITGVRNTLDDTGQIRRRRHCRFCKHLFWTVEVIEDSTRQDEISELMQRLSLLVAIPKR